MDQNNDNKPYGPVRYKEIVRERYLISKHTNTSYSDTKDITPIEREYLLEFITDDLSKKAKAMDKIRDKSKMK